MKSDRRHFLNTALTGGLVIINPIKLQVSEKVSNKYQQLDAILAKPVLKKEIFSSPVIIESVELLRMNNSFLCRVRSKDGAEGISVANNEQMKSLYPVFLNRLQPFFKGKNALDLEKLLEEVYV